MAFKTFPLEELQVTIYKRTGSTSLRLSVTANGIIRVTIPPWTPYAAGLQFAKTRLPWIRTQQKPIYQLQHGQAIGKAHHLQLLASAQARKVTSRVVQGTIIVRYPASVSADSAVVQTVVNTASVRALRLQAEKLLPQRTETLAQVHGFTYKDIAIKQLKSRWGSCDQHKHIVLNLYLIQLPWDLIDYVILHELTHTRHLHHGPEFWDTMKHMIPNLLAIRKAMRAQQPLLHSSPVS